MRKFVKPVGAPVFIPEHNRKILPEGETVEVTGYIERLIASGNLKVVSATKVSVKNEPQNQETEK
ncbi:MULTISPECIES: hypothetical protein [unclassified Fibrobacter]|uniref:hypothetical protein n=1 Tax=unclassified Fibrobacter TaxID=2634177 RepID=UPI0009213FA3|nr:MULTISPECIES: hypothetical protein [unclassified Fibrobacter]OWV05337.1 hypothetical protein B7993_08670 [Fibrobacter sp. UWH3]SHL28023.1 hypothetical protein SAMN05720765_11258 [Fibrobacter sp. UWH6]